MYIFIAVCKKYTLYILYAQRQSIACDKNISKIMIIEESQIEYFY